MVRAITAGEPYGQACISKAQPYIETVHTKAQENAFVAARIDMYQPYVAKAMEVSICAVFYVFIGCAFASFVMRGLMFSFETIQPLPHTGDPAGR